MLKSGISISDIAESWGLAYRTIQTHMARFIETGEVKFENVVPLHKIELIKKAILKLNPGFATAPAKEFLGDDYSYGDSIKK